MLLGNISIGVAFLIMIVSSQGIRESHFIDSQHDDCSGTGILSSSLEASNPQSFTNRCVIRTVNGTLYRGRNVYLMGNSVIRHYSFTILSFLEGMAEDLSMDRQHEKSICHDELDTDTCSHYTKNGDTAIHFKWKNFLGLETLYDDGRDICPLDKSTRDCFKHVFKEALRKDILVMGSIPMDVAMFREAKMSSSARTLEQILHAVHFSNVSFATDMIDIVLDYFPGTVIWLNYPFVISKNHALLGYIDSYSKVTWDAVNNSIYKHRIKFLNLKAIQMENKALYADFIHHPGALSKLIVSYIYQHIALY